MKKLMAWVQLPHETIDVEIVNVVGQWVVVQPAEGESFFVTRDELQNPFIEELPDPEQDAAAVDALIALNESQEWLDQAEIDTRRYYGEA